MSSKVLYSTLYGSHLYGTNTPSSDLDIKRIVLPSLDDLLLCKRVENKVTKTNNEKNTKNGADDVDQEDIPLQVFVKDFVDGQTYALEIAFSADGSHAKQLFEDPMLKDMLVQLRAEFLTSNVRSVMGYVFNQANIYSFKGERLNCAREFMEIIKSASTQRKFDNTALGDLVGEKAYGERFEALAFKYPRYFRIDLYDIGKERLRRCFLLLEKTFPYTNTLAHTLKVADTLISKYGSRSEAASESNVDWKAMMHAVRIADEGLELLQQRRITLPRPQPERLLQIKRGELPIEALKDELVQKLDQLKELSLSCGLPNSNDQGFRKRLDEFSLKWLRQFYSV